MNDNTESAYQEWVKQPNLPANILLNLNNMKNDPDQKKDAFGTVLSFGTAGMRGVMGAGTNRMNIYTVRQAAEGLASFMDTLDDATRKRGVAISFDSRYHSKEFAHESAKVLGFHNIPTFVFDDIRPTPELSFAVRHLHTYAGIMITASHNPKQYNGFKIYGQDGGQMPPKESDLITSYIRKNSDLFAIQVTPEQTLRESGVMNLIGENVDIDYLAKVKTVNIDLDLIKNVGANMKFVYSPLHGTGKVIARRALEEAGFKNYVVVPEQTIADPEFPTTPFPNPEFPQAFDLAKKLGKKVSADVLIASDPDADRLGCAVRQPDGNYQLLSGNQIASVLLNYILSAKKKSGTLPENGTIVKSIVSTDLAVKIAASYGVATNNVLTGFKFIAEAIHHYETAHDHTFLFGFEESFGYLIKPFVRDKDAIQTVLLLAEVAAYYKSQGKTLYDGVDEMFKKYGYFAEKTIAKEFDGLDGKDKMAHILSELRDKPLSEINGHQVTSHADYSTSILTDKDGKTSTISLPKSNVLKYWLDDETWVAVRPSGTEPKVKFYIEVVDKSQAAVNAKLKSYVDSLDKLIDQLINN
ncbi:phospho-sugar mutase [Lentilactobacillus diolivorans]|mgnify:FL=1|uniref:Phosphoglucomutase n=2 Tax=Lentilactobacillus diolivorans TaxID=179838 RepID=A0A0R1SF31_9LACO|nr:phospho-sugar mutase [Lentilactobacillus diolivorans]KRL65162.1 phosphoglucomutase [Lentilactobacillus diolivorans DSM 14421]GEP24383.1 phosphoglucomutase [Lentilactobacillus diolivorans]